MTTATERSGRLRRLGLRLAAEFGIVVLGVMVALWADGRVAARQQSETEAARIAALSDNLRSTLAALREEQDGTARAARALRKLADMEPGTAARDEVLHGFLYVPDFRPELNVYEDLKSSGELALLTDPQLRRSLATMDARLQSLSAAQSDVATVQQLSFDRFLIDRADLRSLMANLLDMGAVSPDPVDLAFTGTREFRNLVVFKLDLLIQIGETFADAESAVIAAYQLIDPDSSRIRAAVQRQQ